LILAGKDKEKKTEAKTVPTKPYLNVKKVANDTRMPLKKGQSQAFPTAKQHYKLAKEWKLNFNVMASQGNGVRYKT